MSTHGFHVTRLYIKPHPVLNIVTNYCLCTDTMPLMAVPLQYSLIITLNLVKQKCEISSNFVPDVKQNIWRWLVGMLLHDILDG